MSISKKRLAEIAAMPDESIDSSDIPELGAAFFKSARLVLPGASAPVERDEDVPARSAVSGTSSRS